MKTLSAALALALLSGASFVSANPAVAPSHAMAMQAAAPADARATAPKLDAALRSLWHGHVVHTRDYALAVHAQDTAKANAAAARWSPTPSRSPTRSAASTATRPARRCCNCWPVTGLA